MVRAVRAVMRFNAQSILVVLIGSNSREDESENEDVGSALFQSSDGDRQDACPTSNSHFGARLCAEHQPQQRTNEKMLWFY